MRNIFLILFLGFTLLYGGGVKPQKVSLQLLWKNQFEFAGFYMAKEKGFYKELGIELDIKEFEYGINISDKVLKGDADFGVGRSSLILDKMDGKDIVLLFSTFQKSPYVLVSKKRDDLQKVSDFKNKRIMISDDLVNMTAINAMMKTNGIEQKDFQRFKHTFDVEDLIKDKVDLVSVYASNELYTLEKQNIPYTLFDPADHGFNFYTDILFTSNELLKKDPKLVENFYRASIKGWEYAFEHINESVDTIYNNYNTQNKSKEHLLFEANILKKISTIEGVKFGDFKLDVIAQIAQTYKLLDITKNSLKSGDVSFIYEHSLHKDSSIDYDLIWKIALALIVIFTALFYWNRKLSYLNNQIQQSKNKVSILLNNAGQGFLTFGSDFLIDGEYSQECIKLLGEDIENKDIAKVLFDKVDKRHIFKDALTSALNEKNSIKRNSYLSLLPTIIILNRRALKLEYKILEESYFMLIITNITMEKKLEKKIKKEQQTFKMIVTIVSESEVFYETKKEYLNFIHYYIINYIDSTKEPLYNINNIYRVIHTFKGTFSQLYMKNVVDFLHKVESDISCMVKDKNRSNEKLIDLLSSIDFDANLQETLDIIADILGEDFLESENFLKVNMDNVKELQEKINSLLENNLHNSPECQNILSMVQDLSTVKLSTLLKPYSTYTKQLANRLEKEIYDFDIIGEQEIKSAAKIKPFTKSLVHIFRNSIDHGIEDAETRILNNKDEIGSISCTIDKIDDKLHIVIADDGAGIDIEKIKEKAVQKGIDISNMSDEDIIYLIFEDNFSTKDEVDELSGRGIGLASLKEECEKLGGEIKVSTQKGVGSTFEFILPIL